MALVERRAGAFARGTRRAPEGDAEGAGLDADENMTAVAARSDIPHDASSSVAGFTTAEVASLRSEYVYNEVTRPKTHAAFRLLKKLWGVSAWMLELIMVLSAVLGKYADLVVVGALLVINSIVSFVQEQRAAGVVETLPKRLQVTARVLRDSKWQVIASRELVPGDVVRIRSGDVVPEDLKLSTGDITLDESALTGESKDAERKANDTLSSGRVVRRGEGRAWSR